MITIVTITALVFYCNSVMVQAKGLNRFRPHSLQDGPADTVWLGGACPTFVWIGLLSHGTSSGPNHQCHIVTTNAHLGWCCPETTTDQKEKSLRKEKTWLIDWVTGLFEVNLESLLSSGPEFSCSVCTRVWINVHMTANKLYYLWKWTTVCLKYQYKCARWVQNSHTHL